MTIKVNKPENLLPCHRFKLSKNLLTKCKEKVTEPIPVWLPTEYIYALLTLSLKLFMIFQRGHRKSSRRNLPFLILKRWIENSKEKLKDLSNKDKYLIEYHKNDVKMQEMSLERN